MTDTDLYLRINEIKNYVYCPRISYYALCLGIDRETDLSKGGIAEEQITKKRMGRRKGALHAVHEGMRYFDVALVSHAYRLIGRVDELIETPQGVYLVDYKDTERDYGYWALQMSAYRQAAEEMGYNVLGCYVYLISSKTYNEIKLKPGDAAKLKAAAAALYTFVETEVCPAPAKQIGKCRVCQYARFCNDVF